MLEFIISAIVIGLFIAIIVLTVQFTVANIGAILGCAVLAIVIYGLYQLLKPTASPKNNTPTTTSKTVRKETKPMSPKWKMAWAWAGKIIAWVLLWFFAETLIFLYADPNYKIPLFARILLYLLPHILVALFIVRKRLKPLKTFRKKWQELVKLAVAFARVCFCIIVVVAICFAICELVVLYNTTH